MNGSEIQKGKIREKEDIGREKVRQGDGECSGEKGYLCLSVVSTAGCLLKGSQVSYRVREKKKKELLFGRWLMEQRAQNCSIRLSRNSF